jgi:hypothetical protein
MRQRCVALRLLLRQEPQAIADVARVFGNMVSEGVITRRVAKAILTSDCGALHITCAPEELSDWINEGIVEAGAEHRECWG